VPELTEAERQYLTETQSLTLDEAGREVLVGLIYDESSLLSQIVGSSSVRLAANGLRYANGSWPRS